MQQNFTLKFGLLLAHNMELMLFSAKVTVLDKKEIFIFTKLTISYLDLYLRSIHL